MTTTPSTRRTPLVIGVAVVLLVAALAASLYACDRRGGDEEPTARRWTYLPVDEVPAEGARFHPQFLSSDGQTMVAVGNALDEGDASLDLDAWYTTDGLHWQTGDLASHSRAPGEYSEVSGLTRWGGGFFAVGARTSTQDLRRMLGSTAWRSPDGKNWQRVSVPPHDGSLFSLPTLYSDGVNVYSHLGGSTMWRLTPDSSEWEEFPLRGGERCSYRYDAGPGGPGLVAYGHCSDSSPGDAGEAGAEPATRPAILTIDKQGEVSEVSPRIRPQLLYMTSGVARSGETLVAAGVADLGDASGAPSGGASPGGDTGPGEGTSDNVRLVVARSLDGGVSWSPANPIPVDPPALPKSAMVDRIVHTDGSFLALGKVIVLSKSHPTIWESKDGQEWSSQRLPTFADEGLLSSAATVNGRTVVLAVHGTRSATVKGLFVDFAVRADTTAPDASPTPDSATATPQATPASDPVALLGTWRGTVSNPDGSQERGVSLTITPVPGRGPVTPDSLTGKIVVGNLATCTADLGKPTRPGDGALTFGVPSPSFWPETMLSDRRPYCPTTFEIQLEADGRLQWSGDGGFTGTLTRPEADHQDSSEELG
ncbi:hypothetical protein [Streptomyces poriticola]|uniref:hypothetical protein n=1 Tax=Streptomyces poriticola TaxID=3120506 RepID=UPI002FCDE415